MRILGKEITEGIALSILGVIFFSVAGGLGFTYRHQIAWMKFMMDSKNVFELIGKFENAKDPAEKFNTAVKISYHSAESTLAQLHDISESIEKNQPMPQETPLPTGREGAIIKKAIDYVEWAYSLEDYYIGKIPPERISELVAGAKAKLLDAGFKDDFTDVELAKAFPSFGNVKACTKEDYDGVVKANGLENVVKFSSHIFTANMVFSRMLGAESGNAVLREAIGHSENKEHTQILNAILEIQEMKPLIDDSWSSPTFFKKSKDWEQVKELVMPFRRSAPHCFQLKNFRAYMDFQKVDLNAYRAKNLAERLAAYIKLHGEAPKGLEDLENLDYMDRHDAWYSEFKFDRTQTEIVISSIGKDRKPGTEDDFVVHRREFIFGGE